MKWLIVGLGNPGEKYLATRHNAGFMFLNELAVASQLTWEDKDKFFGKVAETSKFYLVKPSTFMNLSGKSVSAVLNFYKIKSDHLIVVHDDLDLNFGQIKLNYAKGPKVHNGLISIENSLGTDQFWNLRIGVDNRTSDNRKSLTGQAYVLSQMSNAEIDQLTVNFPAAIEKIYQVINDN